MARRMVFCSRSTQCCPGQSSIFVQVLQSSILTKVCLLDHLTMGGFLTAAEKVTLHVYRKRSAVLRSVNKHSPAEFLPFGARDTNVYSGVFSADSALAPRFAKRNASQGRRDPENMPHGALSFYREINLPTHCRVYRTHEDAANTPASHVVLCAACENGVYVWDLDDYTAGPEAYLYPPEAEIHVSVSSNI